VCLKFILEVTAVLHQLKASFAGGAKLIDHIWPTLLTNQSSCDFDLGSQSQLVGLGNQSLLVLLLLLASHE
jgi:hypothetical protein